MARLWLVCFVVACRSSPHDAEPSSAHVAAPAGAETQAAAKTPEPTPTPSPDGRDLPAPLYAGMFIDGAEFEYTVYTYKVNKFGERDGGKQRVKCFVHDLVFMHEMKALSARLTCDDKQGPLNGVMFAARDGFWWYDEKRYLAGGFAMDASTKVFDREPKEVESSDARLYSVKHERDGSWCWSETFETPWTGQGLCFAEGRIVSGWAANEATEKKKGDFIEFKLAK